MDIYRPRVADVFISPDMVEKLLPCEYLVW